MLAFIIPYANYFDIIYIYGYVDECWDIIEEKHGCTSFEMLTIYFLVK